MKIEGRVGVGEFCFEIEDGRVWRDLWNFGSKLCEGGGWVGLGYSTPLLCHEL